MFLLNNRVLSSIMYNKMAIITWQSNKQIGLESNVSPADEFDNCCILTVFFVQRTRYFLLVLSLLFVY